MYHQKGKGQFSFTVKKQLGPITSKWTVYASARRVAQTYRVLTLPSSSNSKAHDIRYKSFDLVK
jgi:hypothetical protein